MAVNGPKENIKDNTYENGSNAEQDKNQQDFSKNEENNIDKNNEEKEIKNQTKLFNQLKALEEGTILKSNEKEIKKHELETRINAAWDKLKESKPEEKA